MTYHCQPNTLPLSCVTYAEQGTNGLSLDRKTIPAHENVATRLVLPPRLQSLVTGKAGRASKATFSANQG